MSQQCEVNISGKTVYLAIPCYQGMLPMETALEMTQLRDHLRNAGVSLLAHGERGNGVITEVRNRLLTHFLNSDADYIFWLDDDMIFKSEDVVRMLALCELKDNVACTYPSRSDTPKFYIHRIDRFGENEFDELGLLKAKGVGMGFCCMKREVIQKLAATKETYKDNAGEDIISAFRNGVKDGQFWGEDMNFFYDLYDLGYITYIDPSIALKHVGRKDYDTKFKLD